MKKAMLLVLFVLALTGLMMGQNLYIDRYVLGAHHNKAVAAQAAMLLTAAHSVPAMAYRPVLTPAATHCGDRTPARCMARP